jgi:hypothetical protein
MMKIILVIALLLSVMGCTVNNRPDSFMQCGIMAQSCPEGYNISWIGGQCSVCSKPSNITYEPINMTHICESYCSCAEESNTKGEI